MPTAKVEFRAGQDPLNGLGDLVRCTHTVLARRGRRASTHEGHTSGVEEGVGLSALLVVSVGLLVYINLLIPRPRLSRTQPSFTLPIILVTSHRTYRIPPSVFNSVLAVAGTMRGDLPPTRAMSAVLGTPRATPATQRFFSAGHARSPSPARPDLERPPIPRCQSAPAGPTTPSLAPQTPQQTPQQAARRSSESVAPAARHPPRPTVEDCDSVTSKPPVGRETWRASSPPPAPAARRETDLPLPPPKRARPDLGAASELAAAGSHEPPVAETKRPRLSEAELRNDQQVSIEVISDRGMTECMPCRTVRMSSSPIPTRLPS